MTARALRWERRPDERPSELLEAALRIFAERGYASTRLEDIAASVGVTKGTIYHYFPTKEALLLRAIEHYHEQAFQPLQRALADRRGPVSAGIRLFLRRAFGRLDPARLSVLTLLVQGVARDVPEAYHRWLESGPVRGWETLAQLIEEGKAAGEFRPDADSEVIARTTISGLILQSSWQRFAAGVPAVAIDADRLIDSTADALLHGLRPLDGARRPPPLPQCYQDTGIQLRPPRRHVRRLQASRRSNAPTSPGCLQAAASLRMQSLYSAGPRRWRARPPNSGVGTALGPAA